MNLPSSLHLRLLFTAPFAKTANSYDPRFNDQKTSSGIIAGLIEPAREEEKEGRGERGRENPGINVRYHISRHRNEFVSVLSRSRSPAVHLSRG